MGPHFTKRLMKQIRTNIIAGFFLLIPVVGSIFIFVKLFDWAGRMLPSALGVEWHPVVGLVVSVIIVFLVGLVAKSYLGRKIIAIGNAIIVSIPLLNKIYLVIKQIIDTVTVDKKALFERVVLLEFPRRDCFVVGFVTSEGNEKFSDLTGRKLVAVFVPNVPNPTTGFLLYLQEEELTTVDMPVETALKLILSVGLLGTDKFGGQKAPFETGGKQWNWMDIFHSKSGTARSPDTHDRRD